MILKLHSFSQPHEIDTDKIVAFTWNIELGKIDLILEGHAKPVPIDEELYQLEDAYQEWVNKQL